MKIVSSFMLVIDMLQTLLLSIQGGSRQVYLHFREHLALAKHVVVQCSASTSVMASRGCSPV